MEDASGTGAIIMDNIQEFNDILNSFNINATCVNYESVDNYSFYDVKLEPGLRVASISRFSNEIALALKSSGKPTVKVLHDQGVIRLEFVKPRNDVLNLFDYFTNTDVPEGDLVCLLGQGTDGGRVWMDLAKNPHMIVAGTTGSGKSTLLHNIIANLLNYNNTSIFLIDPKGVEFSTYENALPNVFVEYTYHQALDAINNAIAIMEQRYGFMKEGISLDNLPHIVFIVDEFADLIMQDSNKKLYTSLCKLAQKCRAAKMSIILATQRPSVNIIDGVIKANFPARIACRVSSHIDSKVILDVVGAENLMGHGDALLRDNSRFLDRFQVAYTDAEEIVKFFGHTA